MSRPAWHERRDLPWAKIHARWFNSPSHVDLEITTLGIGLAMILLANQRGRTPDGSGWIVDSKGKSISRKSIARFAHASLADTNSAIDELLAAGTLSERSDGALGFAKLRHWQEDPSAERVRKHRESNRYSNGYGNSDGNGYGNPVCNAQRDRGTEDPDQIPSPEEKI